MNSGTLSRGPTTKDPVVWAAGLGYSDLDAATKFYTTYLDMELESTVFREDREERTLWAKAANRGSRVQLMKFKDGRDKTKNSTAKLMFMVADTAAMHKKLTDAGFKSVFDPIPVPGVGDGIVAQVKGPEDYTIELVQYSTDHCFLGGVGYGVSDGQKAQDFYGKGMGMEKTSDWPLGSIPIPLGDATLADEYGMEQPTKNGALIILAKYGDSVHYDARTNPVKTVHYVPDAAKFLAQIQQAGATIIKPIGKLTDLGDKIGGLAKDPDGYELEILQEE